VNIRPVAPGQTLTRSRPALAWPVGEGMSGLAASRQLREIDLPILPQAWPDECRPIDAEKRQVWCSTAVGRAIRIAIDCSRSDNAALLAGAVHRTIVLVSSDHADLPSDSYRLFPRCAGVLSPMSSVFARGLIADVFEHRLFLIGADIAQR
jgi:hypothetical protein